MDNVRPNDWPNASHAKCSVLKTRQLTVLSGVHRTPNTSSLTLTKMANGDVEADLFYLKRLELYEHEKPFEMYMDIPADAPDQRGRNTEFEVKSQVIQDMRGRIGEFTLDGFGFCVRRFPVTPGSLKKEDVQENYLPQVEQFLKDEVDGVDLIRIFDWRVGATYFVEVELGGNTGRVMF